MFIWEMITGKSGSRWKSEIGRVRKPIKGIFFQASYYSRQLELRPAGELWETVQSKPHIIKDQGSWGYVSTNSNHHRLSTACRRINSLALLLAWHMLRVYSHPTPLLTLLSMEVNAERIWVGQTQCLLYPDCIDCRHHEGKHHQPMFFFPLHCHYVAYHLQTHLQHIL